MIRHTQRGKNTPSLALTVSDKEAADLDISINHGPRAAMIACNRTNRQATQFVAATTSPGESEASYL